MLLQNLSIFNENPLSVTGGGPYQHNTSSWTRRWGTSRNRFAGEGGFSQKCAVPDGYNPHYSPEPAIKDGGIASHMQILAEGDFASAPNLAGGKNAVVAIAGLGQFTNAEGSLITQLVAALAGSGEITDALLLGKLDAVAALAGSGDITAALGAMADLVADLTGEGTITNALFEGYGSMSATIYVNQSEATVTQIVDGVWNALVAEYDESGSMGEAMGAAGTAGDPWTTELPGAYSGDQAGNIIGKKLLTTGKFLGLK